MYQSMLPSKEYTVLLREVVFLSRLGRSLERTVALILGARGWLMWLGPVAGLSIKDSWPGFLGDLPGRCL